MKSFLRLLAAGLLIFSVTDASAQITTLTNSLQLVGPNGTLTLNYNGNSTGTLTFPESGSGFLPTGTTAGQTLRFDGDEWLTADNLLNDGAIISIAQTTLTALQTGFAITNTALGNAASITATNGIGLSVTSNASSAAVFGTSNSSNSQHILTAGTNGTGDAGKFSISNGSSIASAVHGQALTAASGSAVYGESTGAGIGVRGTSANGTAGSFRITSGTNNSSALIASTFGNGSAINASSTTGTTIYATATGGGQAAEFVVPASASTGAAVEINAGHSGSALAITHTGVGAGVYVESVGYGVYAVSDAGVPGTFIGTAGNIGYTLNASMFGAGGGGSFMVSNNASNSNALYGATNGTASSNAVYGEHVGSGVAVRGQAINGTAGQFNGAVGVRIEGGSLIGSYVTFNSGTALPSNVVSVLVNDDGTASPASVNVPASGTNGQILYVGTSDTQGLTLAGKTITNSETITLIYLEGWKVTQ